MNEVRVARDVVLGMMVLIALALAPQNAAKSEQPALDTPAASNQGKEIFASRCAKCHDQDANKKLPDGTTLLQRLAKSKDPEARLGTRLKNEQERHQVMLYMQPLLARLRSAR